MHRYGVRLEKGQGGQGASDTATKNHLEGTTSQEMKPEKKKSTLEVVDLFVEPHHHHQWGQRRRVRLQENAQSLSTRNNCMHVYTGGGGERRQRARADRHSQGKWTQWRHQDNNCLM